MRHANPLSSAVMLSHPEIYVVVRGQAQAFLARFAERPQIGRVFASHQRWLLGQIALMQYFETGQIVPARYYDFVDANGVASRNTADAFLKEMLTYGVAREISASDRRSRPLVPSELSLDSAAGWLEIHLKSLDRFDGGERTRKFTASGRDMRQMHPLMAAAFMRTPELREQPAVFDPFVWLNNGNIIIDWLIANSQDADNDAAEVSIGVVSIQSMAETFHLSRSHLTRKLLDASDMQTIGWKGRRGRSELWVSNEFRREYARAQAVKLEIIDAACATCGLF
ncbi:hypothetical protein BJF91_19620 [Allorhizobium taibaishanense]|nr:hypothetical protein BJF91_19620 [Allorhizobium taibaishanense]